MDEGVRGGVAQAKHDHTRAVAVVCLQQSFKRCVLHAAIRHHLGRTMKTKSQQKTGNKRDGVRKAMAMLMMTRKAA